MQDTTRKLTRNTIKPVLAFIGGWDSDIHSLNTAGATFYEFTLDTYNSHNSWRGGFSYGLSGCYSYNGVANEAYAVNLSNGDIYDLDTKQIIMNVKG